MSDADLMGGLSAKSLAPSDALRDIVAWSQERPLWQRDALRRLLMGEPITAAAIGEFVELCKGAHGLVSPPAASPLTEADIAIPSSDAKNVSLASVTHHRGVNALANEQTLSFGPQLTVVFGRNAAGKSGFTRILKRACRSRGREDILGNVLSGEAPLAASATLKYRDGGVEKPLKWTHDGASAAPLASISVFDAHSAAVYLRDKTDVAFRPYGLDVFDKLSVLCADVRQRIEQEQRQIAAPTQGLPVLQDGTRAKRLLDGLTGLTKDDAVRALATVSAEEKQTMLELQGRLRDLQAADPTKRAKELSLKEERLKVLGKHLDSLAETLGADAIATLHGAAEAFRSASKALVVLRDAAFSAGTLQGTGGLEWSQMWDAVGRFSLVAFPAHNYPNTSEDARCPFCQQDLTDEGIKRLTHFAEFVSSRAHNDSKVAQAQYLALVDRIERVVVEPAEVSLAIREVEDEDSSLAAKVKEFIASARAVSDQVQRLGGALDGLPKSGVTGHPSAEVAAMAAKFGKRAQELASQVRSLSPEETATLNDIESRVKLSNAEHIVLQEIERKRRLAAYRQCLDDTDTHAITRKSTELTKALVTDQLRSTFGRELNKLDFTHLLVEVRPAGGNRGALFHRIEFSNAPGVDITQVLSEGESRALSLAAFMTELSTAPMRSAIIFDDPVSSLDHVWRERIARRLVEEASDRQVIVFTHDLLFVRLLLDESVRQGVDCAHQYLRRNGQPGLSSESLPWHVMRVTDRIGRLRDLWHRAEKSHRTNDFEAYEGQARDLYALLREAWEQAVGEVLLNDVVERYRPSVQTQKVRVLHDITADDCKAVDDAMTECSRWIRGHDAAAADGTPLPSPPALKALIDSLEAWVKGIRRRRN